LSGQKIERPVSVSPLIIGQLIALNRAFGRDVEEILRHEQSDERHHLQVGLERAEFLPHLGLAVGGRLIDRKLRGDRRFFERIGLLARLFGRDVDRDDLFAAFKQRLQHGLAEGLLPMNDDSHRTSQTFLRRHAPRKRGIQ